MTRGTKQEHVDSLTMQIHNPNVRGSGYIEHPPQVPFGGRVVVQPSTVQDGDVPEWFSHGVPGYQQQQRVAPRVPGQYQGHVPQQTYRAQQQQQQQQQPHRAPAPTTTAFTHPKQHVAAPAGAPVAARTTEPQTSAPVEEKKLSKSAKAKLRKKMREGKI
ncbi:hypothetical protein M9435_002591 [Picochlorum sp. BPE23]|nr:hypothetical protein M9435_002591 [Picochlorum sp. BPE23]